MKDLKGIEKNLKDNGYKLTGQRKIIIEMLEEKPGHYTALEIFEMVKKKCETINFSTIYRNLELLSNLKIIQKLNIQNGISHFELSTTGHHHHIVCKGCGDMKEIDLCPYEVVIKEEMEALGFKPTEHQFEIYGYCSRCSKNNE